MRFLNEIMMKCKSCGSPNFFNLKDKGKKGECMDCDNPLGVIK